MRGAAAGRHRARSRGAGAPAGDPNRSAAECCELTLALWLYPTSLADVLPVVLPVDEKASTLGLTGLLQRERHLCATHAPLLAARAPAPLSSGSPTGTWVALNVFIPYGEAIKPMTVQCRCA